MFVCVAMCVYLPIHVSVCISVSTCMVPMNRLSKRKDAAVQNKTGRELELGKTGEQ